jgi:hypothetical protein
MGCYYELSVAQFVVDLGKGYLAEHVMVPFQPADRRERLDAEGEPRHHVYVTRAEVAARRLDLLGFSLSSAKAAFLAGFGGLEKSELKEWPDELRGDGGFETWLRHIRTAIDAARRLEHIEADTTDDACLKFILGWAGLNMTYEHMFGFPNGDPRLVLRCALAASRPDDEVVLDFDDLVTGGYLHDDGDLWKISREPIIIVTEGKSDSRLLGRSLDVLFPELKEFIAFIDFETANARGGTPEQIQFARMLVGCGIKNRVLFLFDNDTAGVDALEQLKVGPLPANVFAMTLPSREFARNYPTVGPSGPMVSDVNGRACSLELYFGADMLTENGQLIPVRWVGFNDRLQEYQGQISNKAAVQKRFEDKLEAVRVAPVAVPRYDFAGVREIFEAIIAAVSARPNIPRQI